MLLLVFLGVRMSDEGFTWLEIFVWAVARVLEAVAVQRELLAEDAGVITTFAVAVEKGGDSLS